jgi:hypothetical protein
MRKMHGIMILRGNTINGEPHTSMVGADRQPALCPPRPPRPFQLCLAARSHIGGGHSMTLTYYTEKSRMNNRTP